MTMEWIKIEHALLRKPEVFQIAARTGFSRHEVIGALVELFIWYDEQLADGELGIVPRETIKELTGSAEFSTALIECGWLREKDGGLLVSKFDRHNGKTAKKRALTARRNAEMRWREKRQRHARDASGVTLLSQPRLLEEEEEQKPNQEKANPRASAREVEIPTLPDWVPADTWQAYVEMRKKLHRPLTGAAMKLAVAKLERLRAYGHDPRAVLEQSVLGSYLGLFELKPETAAKGAKPFVAAHTGFDQREYKGSNIDELDWARTGERNE